MKSLLTTMILVVSGFSAAQSFTSGNKFSSTPIFGNLTVMCNDPSLGPRTVQYQCVDVRLAPAEYEYFTGPVVDADTVELQATFENGKKSSIKISGYQDGKSTDRINLWIATLFQKPLLSDGLNKVSFVLKKSGNLVQQGQFDVHVDRGPSVKCPPGVFNSPQPSDCDSPYTVCTQYFQQYNYCL